MSISLEKVLKAVKDLPQPPKTSFQAISMLENPDYTMDQVAEYIVMDESATLKMLQLANSAQYAGNSRTLTVKDAMVRIGVNNVKLILFQDTLEQAHIEPNPFFIELWKSALFTAFLTKVASNLLQHHKPDVCFTAGLICDMGLLMINQFSTEFCKAFAGKVAKENLDMAKAEQSAMKFTHQEVGLALASQWNLPNTYKTIIEHHHDPSAVSSQILASDYALLVAVHIANCMSPLFGDEGWKNIKRSALDPIPQCPYMLEDMVGHLLNSYESTRAKVNYFTQLMFGLEDEAIEKEYTVPKPLIVSKPGFS